MKINKTELLKAMTACMPGVEKGNTILEGADTFAFSNNLLHSYNDNISVTVKLPVDEELKGVAKSVDFFKLISKFKEEEIEIKLKNGKWELKNGKSKAKITLLKDQISDYVKSLETDNLKFKAIPEEFYQALKLCSIANNYSAHNGIYVDGKKMCSTDMRRLNYFDLSKGMGCYYLPDIAVRELLKFNNIKSYSLADEWIHFKTDDETIFSCRLNDEETFPAETVFQKKEGMQKEEGDLSNSLPHALSEVIDRVSSLSRDLDGNQTIRMTFNKKEIVVDSFRDSGEITEPVELETPFEEDVELEIWMDVPFIKEALDKVPNFYIKKIQAKKGNTEEIIEIPVVVFTADNYTQVVATVNPND